MRIAIIVARLPNWSSAALSRSSKRDRAEAVLHRAVAARIERFRSAAYRKLRAVAKYTDLGWVAEPGPEARRVAAELQQDLERLLKELAVERRVVYKRQIFEVPPEIAERLLRRRYYVKYIEAEVSEPPEVVEEDGG